MKNAVSIHAPVKVRHFALSPWYIEKGFNSRTCEGATDRRLLPWIFIVVSIHAPVKVRQRASMNIDPGAVVSIHAPVKVRHNPTHLLFHQSSVSIHAPVKVRLIPGRKIDMVFPFQFTHL